MSKFFYTRNEVFESKVIYQAFYNEDNNSLVVVLNSGNAYGYDGVSPETFQEFVEANSAGQYYNYYIKGRYTTFDADNFEEFVKDVPVESPNEVRKRVMTTNAAVDSAGNGEVEQVVTATKFTIHYTVGNSDVKTLNMPGNSVDDALAKFNDIADAACDLFDAERVKVTGVMHNF